MPITQTSLKSKNYNALGIDEIADDISNIITVVNAIPESPTTAIVNISSAQILAMGSSPIELLPAPGAGKYYSIDKVVLEYTHISSGYTLADLLTLSQTSSYLTILSAAIITNSGNRAMVTTKGVGSLDLVNEAALSEISDINTAITLGTYGNSNPTLGNGTMRAIITYTVRTFGA